MDTYEIQVEYTESLVRIGYRQFWWAQYRIYTLVSPTSPQKRIGQRF